MDVYVKPYNKTLAIPWFPVFGNHDYGGYTQAQLDRTMEKIDPYWTFPSSNYSMIYVLPQDIKIGLLFIDTTTIAPTESKYTNEKGGVSEETQASRINNQLYHIRRMLQEMDEQSCKWILVFGHYPLYSKGEHGDTDELVRYLLPLFLEYKVSVYFSGHDHMSMHLVKDGIHYFIAGELFLS